MTTDLRYPIGTFQSSDSYSRKEILEFITSIEALPSKLREEVKGMSNTQLDTPYREGGWTVRQVIHHLADSHMNAYIRTKWTLTEESPTIKAYHEKEWAVTSETTLDPELSIALLAALHRKWTALLSNLSDTDLKRFFTHPETQRTQTLERMIGLYAWHGAHHLAHITSLKKRMEWK